MGPFTYLCDEGAILTNFLLLQICIESQGCSMDSNLQVQLFCSVLQVDVDASAKQEVFSTHPECFAVFTVSAVESNDFIQLWQRFVLLPAGNNASCLLQLTKQSHHQVH